MKDLAPNNLNFVIGGLTAMFQLSGETGYYDFGHLEENSLERLVQRGVFKSARSGVLEEIYSWINERGMNFKIGGVEMTKRNLQIALLGSSPANQSQASGSVVDEAFTARHDRWAFLAARRVSSVVVTNAAGTVTYVLNTDYELDADLGGIRVLSTGAITADQALLVDYTRAAMTTLTSTNLLQTSRFAGAMKVKVKAENNGVYELHFPSVEVQPEEGLVFSTNAPVKFASFTVKVLKSTASADATAEWGTFREIVAPS